MHDFNFIHMHLVKHQGNIFLTFNRHKRKNQKFAEMETKLKESSCADKKGGTAEKSDNKETVKIFGK